MNYGKISDILFFETTSRPHHILLYTENEMLDFLGSIQEIEETLGSDFMRVHRSYLVNLKKIDSYNSKLNEITFKNGSHCLVAKRMKKALLEAIKINLHIV